jgi:hypothetical protein
MSKRVQVTFDAADPHALGAWWAELLGYEVEDGHDFITGLIDAGLVTESDVVRIDGRLRFADAVAASDPGGTGPRLYFQRVPEGKAAKNRVHLDVPAAPEDLDAAVDRLVSTGATLVDHGTQGDHRWAVMQDPEGNEFCLQ